MSISEVKKSKEQEEEDLLNLNTLCTLKPEDYWEWRATMEEIDHAKTSHNMNVMKMRLMELQVTNLKMEAAIFRGRLSESAAKVDKYKEDYVPYREKLENKYKISLKDATIRPDYRVVKIPYNK